MRFGTIARVEDPSLGEHAAKWVRLAYGEPTRLGFPATALDRLMVVSDLMNAHTCVQEEILEDDFERVVLNLTRIVHEALVVLARFGFSAEQVKEILRVSLEEEMSRVDPDLGQLSGNEGKPYKRGRRIGDPPGFLSMKTRKAIRKAVKGNE